MVNNGDCRKMKNIIIVLFCFFYALNIFSEGYIKLQSNNDNGIDILYSDTDDKNNADKDLIYTDSLIKMGKQMLDGMERDYQEGVTTERNFKISQGKIVITIYGVTYNTNPMGILGAAHSMAISVTFNDKVIIQYLQLKNEWKSPDNLINKVMIDLQNKTIIIEGKIYSKAGDRKLKNIIFKNFGFDESRQITYENVMN
jgi:hypothetical protein